MECLVSTKQHFPCKETTRVHTSPLSSMNLSGPLLILFFQIASTDKLQRISSKQSFLQHCSILLIFFINADHISIFILSSKPTHSPKIYTMEISKQFYLQKKGGAINKQRQNLYNWYLSAIKWFLTCPRESWGTFWEAFENLTLCLGELPTPTLAEL